MRSDAKVALGVSAVCLAAIIGYALFVPAEKPAGTSMAVRPATVTPAPSMTPVMGSSETPTTQPTSMPWLSTSAPSDGLTLSAPTAGMPGGMMPSTQSSMSSTWPPATPTTPANGTHDWDALLAGKTAAAGATGAMLSGTGSRMATGNTPTFGTVSTPPSVLPSGFGSTTRASLFGTSTAGTSTLAGDTYAIKRGDTFATIAAAKYGNSKYWKVIADANPGVDSRRLKVGQSIKLPELPSKYSGSTSGTVSTMKTGANTPTSNTPGASFSTGAALGNTSPTTQYQVVSGDSLYRISTKLYGTPAQADAIYELNKETIGTNKANLKIGQTLKLPTPPTVK